MRSIWRGSISFGLVNIPVRLYSATENRDIRFNSLHRECGSQIRYKKFCPNCEREVEQDELVKGYPLDQGEFVLIEDEELQSLPLETAKRVDILDFVSLTEIDPIYYDRSYYLEPDEGAQKPYFLLRRAMLDSKRVALAKVALRQKESLACVRVYDKVLVMETMLYPDEIRHVDRLAGVAEEPELSEKELDMAVRLVDNLTEPFTPEKYQDHYRQALEELIQAKVKGDEKTLSPAVAPTGRVIDLMEALEASLNATSNGNGNGASATRSKQTKRTSAAKREKETATR